jgi:hypothetical protein
MLRKFFFGLATVLVGTAASQAGMILQAVGPVDVGQGLSSFQINAVATAGETINGIADPALVPKVGTTGLGAHQVSTPITNANTGTRQDQIGASPLWSDTWQPFDTYFLFTSANSLKVGAGTITETRNGTGATLPSAGFGAPPTGYGPISVTGGAASYAYTVASGLPGTSVPIAQVVQRTQDISTLTLTIINNQGGTSLQSVDIGVPEPATFSLLGLALAGMFGFIRRR